MSTTGVDVWTIIKGAFRRAWGSFWLSAAGGAFVLICALIVKNLGLTSLGVTFIQEAFSPTVAGLFLVLWGAQVGITLRLPILDRVEDWFLNFFLGGAGALVGAAFTIFTIAVWRGQSTDIHGFKLIGNSLLVILVVHVLTGTAAFLRDHSNYQDVRQLRRILGFVSVVSIVIFYLIMQAK